MPIPARARICRVIKADVRNRKKLLSFVPDPPGLALLVLGLVDLGNSLFIYDKFYRFSGFYYFYKFFFLICPNFWHNSSCRSLKSTSWLSPVQSSFCERGLKGQIQRSAYFV